MLRRLPLLAVLLLPLLRRLWRSLSVSLPPTTLSLLSHVELDGKSSVTTSAEMGGDGTGGRKFLIGNVLDELDEKVEPVNDVPRE